MHCDVMLLPPAEVGVQKFTWLISQSNLVFQATYEI